MRSWDEALVLHQRAVDDYHAAAKAVTSWDAAPAPDKWSPAQVTAHLNLAFEAILCELGGGPPLALRTRWYHRVVLRFTIQRRMLRGGPFPTGARAPRETRPPTEAMADKPTSLAEFRRLGDEVNGALAAAAARKEKFRFRHPYFGYMPAADAVYTSARHIDHHRAQIIGALRQELRLHRKQDTMGELDRERSADELAMIARMKAITAKLPEVDIIIDGFGHTTFKVAKKSFVMIGRGHADEGSLSVKADLDTQEALIKRGPWVRTPYIGQHGWVSIFGSVTSDWEEIEELTRDAYYRVAPKRLRKQD